MKNYVSYVGVVNGRTTEAHKTRKGAQMEAIKLMQREGAQGYYIKERATCGVSWNCLDD